ncbi:MAG: transposase [Methanomassiliicoccaceae archaeon]|nr:transposase [Methanomassiliicoccaceae archaeon]
MSKSVEHYLGSVGVLVLADTFKERGVPLSRVIVAVCTCILMGSNSMQRCADWLSDANVRKEFGIEKKVSQRTINRALEIVVDHAGGLMVRAWKGLSERYRFDDTDTNVDGSAVVFNGPMSELGRIGHPRDFKDQSRPQVEFMVAQLQRSKIPFFIRPYEGNTADVTQYRDSLPDIFDMIRTGSWIVMDNGGAAGDVLDSIVERGNKYLTRVRMNTSDDLRILENREEWEYVEDGTCCLSHTFTSSGRTTYIFFSVDNRRRSYNAAERRVRKMIDAARSYDDGKFKASDFVTVKKNVAADVNIEVSVQTKFDYDDPDMFEWMVLETMGVRSGHFKLESSEQLTPSEALGKYRARSSVEHLIHSLKRVTGLKPLRVWKRSSIHGSMMLALFSEMAMAMARYELEPRTETKMKSGKMTIEETRPSTESMVWSLSQLTVCRIVNRGCVKEAVYSNWNRISSEVMNNIRSNMPQKGVFAGG